jgi:preprotein translocase subunit YajC
MAILSMLGISDAYAAAAPANGAAAGMASFLPMMLVFIVGAYFLMIRPQNKRAKAHRQLMSDLSKGDEVVTIGGIVGKVAKLTDDFITLTVSDNVEVTVQKSAISNVLPKGTLKNIAG